MNSKKTIHFSTLSIAAMILFGTIHRSAAATWSGGSSTTNGWSDGANWDTATPPGASDTVIFGSSGVTNVAGAVNNTVDANYTFLSLTYPTLGSVGSHTSFINPGASANVSGSGGTSVFVGTGASLGSGDTITYRLVGPGTLTVTNPTGVINSSQGGANSDHFATLDLTGLTNFSCVVSQIFVGCIADTATYGLRPMGIFRLAETNYIQTSAGINSPGIMVACYPTSDTNLRGTEQIVLGRHNVINSDAISIGGTKTTGSIVSRTGITGAFASLRGSAGGSDKVKVFGVGDGRAGMFNYNPGGTSAANSGTFDATGVFLDALVQDLYVPRTQTNGAGSATGTLTFDQGSITTDNLFVGYHTTGIGAAIAANATGTVNLNGTATVTVNNDLVMTRKLGSSTPVATLNVSSNATLNVKGNIVTTGGTSTIALNGLINMQPSGDATPGYVSIGTLSGSGTITNATSVTNTTSLTPGAFSTPGTLTIASNFTVSTGAPMIVNFGNATTVGGGVNDLLSVYGDVNLNSNAVVLAPIGTALSGTYRLIDFTGTRNGFLSITNPTRQTLALGYPANQVNLTVSGSAGNVRWNSTSSGAWDLTTSNWFNTGSSAVDKFYQLDNVLLNDSGSYQTTVLLGTTLYPGGVTVNSSTLNYILGGGGKISGGGSLTKQGSSTLTVSNANDFTGPVTISGGTLRTANGAALGTTNSGTTVASGATLDVYGTSLFNPGEFVTISGTGVGGAGAIINSGADQNNGIRYVSLAADATIGSGSPGRWDIRGPSGAGTFSGGLYLNGFTLTKVGAGKNSLVDSVITNAGSIVMSNGTVGLTRSIIDGPGTITGFGTNTFQIENSSTGYIAKPFVYIGGGGILQVTGNGFTLFSSITNNGGLTVDAQVGLTLTNIISGAGALIKSSAGTLTLQAPDLGTGSTTITGGRLTVSTNSSISATPSIAVGAGATLDVSALSGGLTLASGQTLSGSGTVIGDVTSGAGTGVVPGSSPGTLTFSNHLTLNNSSNVFELAADPSVIGSGVNDLVLVTSNLTLSGVNTIKIVPLATLSNAPAYTLFQYGTLSGSDANLDVQSDSRYSFTVVDTTTTAPYVKVQVAGSGSSASLLWKGNSPVGDKTAWDTKVTTNWLNGATPDKFFLGDNVVFDDTAATNKATLVGTVRPAAIALSNNVLSYTFGGLGNLVAGSLDIEGSGGLSISNSADNSVASAATINAGSLTLANVGMNTFSGGLKLNAGSVLVANPAVNVFGPALTLNGGTMTFNQSLPVTLSTPITNDIASVAGTLIKEGLNSLTISGGNTNFDGPILVNAGTLRAGNVSALGANSAGTTVASGATFDINGFSLYNPGDLITISGAGLSSTGAVINTGAAQQNAIRAITLASDATIGSWNNRWDIRGPGGSGTFSGAVNLGGFTLTKAGPGRVSIVDANMTDAGSVEVPAGTLAFTRTSVDGAGYINIGPNTLLLENNSVAFTFNKPLIFSNALFQVVGNAIPITCPITNSGNSTFDLAVNLTTQGTITGPGSLTKIGTATLILQETNNYAGGTLISAGTIQLGVNGTTGNLPPQPSGVLTNNGTLVFNHSDDLTFSDQIVGTGGIQQIGSGTVFLGVSNSFSGQTFLNSTVGGVIRISHPNALGDTNGNTRINGDVAANSRLELIGGLNLAEPFQLDGRQGGSLDIPHIRSISGNNTLNGPIVFNTGGTHYNFQSDADLLTVNSPFVPPSTANTRRLKLMGDGNGVWNGVISNSLDTLVPGLLAKTGNGTWTLTASNVYSGATTISAGTLALAATGSMNVTTNIDVQSGATFNVSAVSGGFVLGGNQTLMGSGTVIGNVTGNGTVSPGASVGTLTFANNLVLAGTTVMELDRLASPNADLIVASGLTYGGALVVTNIGDPLQSGDTFNLFDWTSRSGSFTSIILPPLGVGRAWDTSSLSVDGTIKVMGFPIITGFTVSGTDFIVNGTNGVANGQYIVLTSTNVDLARSNWTRLVTNTFDGSGNFSFTNGFSSSIPQKFYTIQLP